MNATSIIQLGGRGALAVFFLPCLFAPDFPKDAGKEVGIITRVCEHGLEPAQPAYCERQARRQAQKEKARAAEVARRLREVEQAGIATLRRAAAAEAHLKRVAAARERAERRLPVCGPVPPSTVQSRPRAAW